MPILSASNLRFEYPGKLDLHIPRFEIERGEMIIVIGPNAAGKSTLCKLLAGLLPPAAGSTLQHEGAWPVLIWQEGELFPLTVEANLRLVPHDRETLENICDDLSLRPLLKQDCSRLSGGERQRVAIARALVAKDRHSIIYDEPTRSLDPRFVEGIAGVILEAHAKQKLATIVVTHEERLVSLLSAADPQVCVLDPGRRRESPIRSELTPPMPLEAFFRSPPSLYAAEFLGHEIIYKVKPGPITLRNLGFIEDGENHGRFVAIPPKAVLANSATRDSETVQVVGTEFRRGQKVVRYRWMTAGKPMEFLGDAHPGGESKLRVSIDSNACVMIGAE